MMKWRSSWKIDGDLKDTDMDMVTIHAVMEEDVGVGKTPIYLYSYILWIFSVLFF